MRWLNLAEVLDLHRQLNEQSGGSPGIRSRLVGGFACSALADLWWNRSLSRVSAEGRLLGFFANPKPSVVMLLNGVELLAGVDESEAVVLRIATGVLDRESLARWLAEHQVPSLGD